MLEELLAAYQSEGRDRIRISGEDPGIDDRSATPMALLFHELATNATKYGALSSVEGSVELTISCADDRAMFDWRERGAPSISEPSAARVRVAVDCNERRAAAWRDHRAPLE